MNIQKLFDTCTSSDQVKDVLLSKNLVVKDWTDRMLVTYTNKHRGATKGVENSSKKVPNFSDPVCKEAKGVIIATNPLSIICYGMDKFETINDSLTRALNIDVVEYLKNNWDKVTVERCVDGSLVKFYYFNGVWTIATNRCIDSKQARCNSSITFYDMAIEALHNTYMRENGPTAVFDFGALNKDYVYSFVLCHPSNRIVVNYSEAFLIHVATRQMTNMEEIDTNIGILKAPPETVFSSYDDFIATFNEKCDNQVGYVLKFRQRESDKSFKRVKFEVENFKYIKTLRGSGQDMVYRYLWLKLNDMNSWNEFNRFYPEYGWIEWQVGMLVDDIHLSYMEHFIHKNRSFVPLREYWSILGDLHTLHIRTRQATTKQIVAQYLHACPAEKICKLLRIFDS